MDTLQTENKVIEELKPSAAASTKKPTNRPAMQIYRPPGLRSDGSSSTSAATTTSSTKPKQAAGQKLSSSDCDSNVTSHILKEENNNKKDCGESTSSRASSRASNNISSDDRHTNGSLKRTESSLSSESSPSSQKSYGSNSNKLNGQYVGGGAHQQYNKRINSSKKEHQKKKVMSEHEIEKAITELRALQLHSHASQIEQWIGGAFCDEELAECIGSALCRHAIEGGGGSGVGKLCANFKYAPSIGSFVKGLIVALSQYLECRHKIRENHFRMWISFIQFLTELYSNLGSDSKGGLATIVFDVFNYLLRPPILEHVKIQELECLISILIKGGYDLERECPDRLALLKDLIRDAFIDVSEPWARKMILLLLELGASSWKLPTDANEYYFNETAT